MYGLKLLRQSKAVHDAKKGKKLIQIKATGGDRVALSSEPEHLIVLKIENGKAPEIFNGPGGLAWKSSGKRQKNGQKGIYLSKLRKLMEEVRQLRKRTAEGAHALRFTDATFRS